MPQCMARVTAMLGCSPPEGFETRVQQRTEAVLRAHVQPVEGVREVLNARDIAFCVASSGAHSKIRTTLGATELLDLFRDRVFSAQDVKHAKPAPDLSLPARCLDPGSSARSLPRGRGHADRCAGWRGRGHARVRLRCTLAGGAPDRGGRPRDLSVDGRAYDVDRAVGGVLRGVTLPKASRTPGRLLGTDPARCAAAML